MGEPGLVASSSTLTKAHSDMLLNVPHPTPPPPLPPGRMHPLCLPHPFLAHDFSLRVLPGCDCFCFSTIMEAPVSSSLLQLIYCSSLS